MQLKVLPLGFAAYACFASSVIAGPVGTYPSRATPSTYPNKAPPGPSNPDISRVVAREPQLVVPEILPPIYIEVRPDGLIQVTAGDIHIPTNKTNTTESSSKTLVARRKVREPTFFDKRPERYISPILPYTQVANRTERDEHLSTLWGAVSDFNKLDNGNYYGPQKWFLLQRFNVGIVLEKDDNHEDINFVARVFDTTPETIKWFSNQMTTSSHLREDEHYPEFDLYEPIDHYNWIRKAHSIMRRMTAVEQRILNDNIDNISKLSTDELYNTYELFEVHPDMLPEHKLQAAEFFQMIKLEFPARDQGNSVKSSRAPVQIYDWTSKQHPRRTAFRPVDALARYAIPATDSDHSDWTSKTAIKIAHMTPEQQRELRDHVRLMPKSYAPTPANLKLFYDSIDVDWQGKDSDAKKAEVAEMLCVRELVFSEKPKWIAMTHKYNWALVRQQPAMVNVCTEEQRDARLRDLFYIERWDADHKDPQAQDQAQAATNDTKLVSRDEPSKEKEPARGKLTELGEKIGEKLDKFAELFKPGGENLKEHMEKFEMLLDHDIHNFEGKMQKFEKAMEPLAHDVETLGEQAWAKLKDELLLPI